MFVSQMILGAILIVITVLIHALALDRLIQMLENIGPTFYKLFRRFWKASLLLFSVLSIFLAHIVQIWLWAFLYLIIQAFPDLETALYFSTSTFTTVGYGDVLLERDWRLLGAFQSANGFILFGWSTATIFEIMSKLYKEDVIRKIEK